MRLAVLAPYWDFFEDRVDSDLRSDRAELVAAVVLALREAGADVVAEELVDSDESGAAAGTRLAALHPDAVVLVQSMCVPPSYALTTLDRLPSTPLVIAAAGRRRGFGQDFSHADIVTEGATVGAPQLANCLARRGRPHDLTLIRVGEDEDHEALAEAARAGAAAGALRRARIVRVGQPIPGYESVDCDPVRLRQATGISIVTIEPSEVRDAFLATEPDATAEVESETLARFDLAPELARGDSLTVSMRLAAALEGLDRRLGASAGAMNCHVPEIRFADEPGIAPCFALGRETSRGVPWSCAGDVVTAVAMLTLKLLGGAALYHEIEALDRDRDEALLANSGEHDLAFADPARRPALEANGWWPSGSRCSACAVMAPPPGPATLVAFTPHAAEPSGFRLITAEGEFTDRRLTATGTAHAAFRFDAGRVEDAWREWVGAGVNHHSAATPGRFGEAVSKVAAHLGIGSVRV